MKTVTMTIQFTTQEMIDGFELPGKGCRDGGS